VQFRSESSRATWPNCPPVFALLAATQLLQKQRDAPTTELVYAHPALGGYRFGLKKDKLGLAGMITGRSHRARS